MEDSNKAVAEFNEHDWLSLVNVKVHMDGFGRIYFDTCEDDLQHLTKPAEDGVRTHCRVYLDRCFEKFVGKRGELALFAIFIESAT